MPDDGHELLPRKADASPVLAPGNGDLARETVRLDVRNAESAMEFFKLPTNRVVELGSQVET